MRITIKTFLKGITIAMILVGFLFQFKTSDRWAFKKIGRRITNNESVWMKTKHGDLAAYCDFLRKHLFTEDHPEHTLVVPDREKTNVRFAGKFWLGVPSLYLFPLRISVSEDYEFEVSRDIYLEIIRDIPLITRKYRDRRYHLVDGLSADKYTTWALYVFENERYVDVFTLPEGYMGIGDNT